MEPPVNTYLTPSLRVHNKGYALVESMVELSIVFDSFVSGISPNIGSTKGGASLTIHGAGFQANSERVVVNVGTSVCDVISIEYRKITCKTRPAAVAFNLPVVVSAFTDISCTADNCLFSYSDDATFVVTSISPSILSGLSNTITLHGNFDGIVTDNIHITVSNIPCAVTSTSMTDIECEIVNLVTGSHVLIMVVEPFGLAEIEDDIISVSGSVDAIAPSDGSIMGGTTLLVTGGVFDPKTAIVTLGGEVCVTESVELETIICITPVAPNGEGDEEVMVVTNGVNLTSQTLFRYTFDRTPLLSRITPPAGIFFIRVYGFAY